MRVFLDTNILASAIGTRGLCSDVFREVLSSEILVVSQTLLDELKRILSGKFGLPTSTISEYLALLRIDSEMAKSETALEISIKDKDDITLLADALSAEVEAFVTGDKELQQLKKIRDMKILSPRKFWEEIKGG